MNIDYAISEIRDLIPDLTLIATYSQNGGLTVVKGEKNSPLGSRVDSFCNDFFSLNTEIDSIIFNLGIQSKFIYFLKIGTNKWIILVSDKPALGVVYLYLQQTEIIWEEEKIIEKAAKPEQISEEADDLKSAIRMQKHFHRQVSWLSDKIHKKALYSNPCDVVTGCTYTFKNYDHSVYIAIADTNLTGVQGAIVTFSIRSLFDSFLNEDRVDLIEAVSEISEKAHSHNLKVTTEEEISQLSPVYVGIVKIDFTQGVLEYASNGLPFLHCIDEELNWTSTSVSEQVDHYKSKLNESSAFFLMNRPMYDSMNITEFEKESKNAEISNKGIIELIQGIQTSEIKTQDQILLAAQGFQ